MSKTEKRMAELTLKLNYWTERRDRMTGTGRDFAQRQVDVLQRCIAELTN